MKKVISMVFALFILLFIVITVSAHEEVTISYKADALSKIGLFKGTEKDYEFEKPVTRAEAITLALRLINEEKFAILTSGTSQFTDVDKSYWAFANICYAMQKGYINGTSETTFEPERFVTVQEFVKMLLTTMGVSGVTIQNAYERGVQYGLLADEKSKLAVSTDGCKLLRGDMVNICYSALVVPIPSQASRFEWNLNDLMPKDENYMFSPLSIKIALAMVAVGADGETKDEILKALKIEDLEQYNEFASQIMKEYNENMNVKLNIANSLWLNTDYYKNVRFVDVFKGKIAKYYNADSGEVNGANAVEKINAWVKNKTNGKITDLIQDNKFLAYIVNAIYFKGEWATQFSETATKKAEFTSRNGVKAEMNFMNMTGYFNYYEDSFVQMIKLPYKDGKTSMYIAITDSRNLDFDNIIEKMQAKRVKISFPKFRTEFSVKLIDTLSKLGIQTAFNPTKADFKNMFTKAPQNIFITDVIHKTFINVDENGTEAIAVTSAGAGGGAMPTEQPIVFNANKPFAYFIRDDVNGEILFVGEYAYTN